MLTHCYNAEEMSIHGSVSNRVLVENLLDEVRDKRITSQIVIQTSQGAITGVSHNLKLI